MAPRRTLCVFTPVVLVGTFLVWLGTACSRPSLAEVSEERFLRVGPEPASNLRNPAPAQMPFAVVDFATVARPAFSLSADSAAVLTEQIALAALAEQTDLSLSSQQWERFATLTLYHQAVRHAYEAKIAALTPISPGHFRLEVPMYADAGDALRDAFYRELRTTLGDVAAEAIEFKLGTQLEEHFAGFGVAVQTLEFVADATRGGSDYTVKRSIVFWGDLAATERLSRKEETHFPSLEDPTGTQWGPFLSLIAPSAAARKARG
jgi:hypothetical protein